MNSKVFHPSREHILGGFVMFLICLLFTGYKVAWFFWVPLVPLVFILWTLWVRTTVSDKAITTRYLFRAGKTMQWEDFRALRFNRAGRAYAVDNQENSIWLPGVTFNSLIDLHKVSSGRIPDPVSPARAATDDKVQVVNKEGYAVLMDKDEYKEYEKQRRREAGVDAPDAAAPDADAQNTSAPERDNTSS
ncbi:MULTISPECIES: PH domain-containing protein [Corynebacterium]|uniref:PH domain-containing protein n=1 Tax=Corynebacterium evansiae TaxID=2913499 RepID=A0A9X3LLK9_9CORY|nr:MULTISPECIES: PH domain-containing protein [Corynebacterium]MCG7268070.1 PH domain-containing protein [Corynebacterium sp. ACRQJ]MCZ9289330.1 PH domain-containing protein [Corynebacterium evansiae]